MKTEGQTRTLQRREVKVEALHAVLERAKPALSEEDHSTLKDAVDTLALLTREVETKGASIDRLRRMLFGSCTEKTSRILIAHEDCLSWGFGAEIAARIASELFDRLDAPIGRVAALDTWIGYHPQLEYEILPQVEDLIREAERLLFY